MARGLAPRIAAWALVVGTSLASVGRASDPLRLPDTTRILDAIEKSRSQRTRADLEAAHRLNAQGDRAYKKRNYGVAFKAYFNSYPNHPNAYAYIMAGDANWRAAVQYHESEARKPARDRPACSLDNSHFARDLAMDVAQHHEVGLALAARENDQRFMQSALYRRARESASCLQTLAKEYEAQPPSACVDVAKLRGCLGAPLIK